MRGVYKFVDALVSCCEEGSIDRAQAATMGAVVCLGPRERAYLEERFYDLDRLTAITRGASPPTRDTWVLGETSQTIRRFLTIEEAMAVVRAKSRDAFIRRVQRIAKRLSDQGEPAETFRVGPLIAHRAGGEHRWLFELAI